MLFNLLSNTMRAVGDSRTPLIFLVIACVINIILDYIFILVFHTGVAGAAYATVIAQLLAGLMCIVVINKKFPELKITKADWKINRADVMKNFKVALPMGFQMSIIAIGTVLVQFALNKLGTVAVAAFTASQKIDQFAGMPMSSFGVTMATYTAQNFGARKYERIRSGVIQCAVISGIFSILIGILFVFTGHRLAAVFIGADPAAVDLAHVYLQINGSCYIILALLFIFRQTLQGLGDSLVPTIAGVMELVMRAFAAIILSEFFGFVGICISSPLAWLGSCVPLGIALTITVKKLLRKSMAERKQHTRTSLPG
jgi:putative MATE family efflux protein